MDDLELVNHDKLERAKANLGGEPSDDALLVEYDKLGGLIRKGGGPPQRIR